MLQNRRKNHPYLIDIENFKGAKQKSNCELPCELVVQIISVLDCESLN